MRKQLLVFLSVLLFSSMALADNGLTNIKSVHTVKTTADRLERALNDKGITIFARINHTEGAKKVGKTLRPTELLIFGHPKVGTPLMQCHQRIAIDLPQKALIWKDEKGQVWLSYNDPNYLAKRHDFGESCAEVIKKLETVLGKFANAAAAP